MAKHRALELLRKNLGGKSDHCLASKEVKKECRSYRMLEERCVPFYEGSIFFFSIYCTRKMNAIEWMKEWETKQYNTA